MRFAHISDTHLGFRQYGLSEREEDFYCAFEDAVRRIILERPDFVIHSGDLFDAHRPQPRALWVAQRCLSKLSEKKIPVYAITGNHDTLMRKGAMPAHVLFEGLDLRLIAEDKPFFVHDGVFICGSPYVPAYYKEGLRETLKILSGKAKGFKKSVIVLHQGLERYLPHEHEIGMEDLPKNFDYYALGHIHNRIVQDFGKGKLAYPGSTELWSVNEYDDYKNKDKGFYLVDLHGDEPEVQPVNLELSREILKRRLTGSGMAEEAMKLKGELGSRSEKPLLYLEVKGGDYERKALHETLVSSLSEHVLSLRVSFRAAAREKTPAVIARTFDIAAMISEAVGDEKKSELAVRLFRSLSEGNSEDALKVAEDFYFSSAQAKERGGGNG